MSPRLWGKVELSADGCWRWTGSRSTNGYAQIKNDGRLVTVHRLIYELLVGPIPAGLELDHLCRVRHCVNPAHLEPVNHRVNTLRGETITAAHAKQTHCIRGHDLIRGDVYITKQGGRDCRACRRYRRSRTV